MDFQQGSESKFRFILVAAKRARQLQAGARPLIQTQAKKLTKVAQQEVAAGLVPYETPEALEAGGDAKKKGKSAAK